VNIVSDKTIICRCEDLSVEEIRNWIEQGYEDIEELKRAARIGMGACQGRTCRRHLINELARATGKKPAQIVPPTFRPPTKPLKFGTVKGGGGDD